jgi:hypothetical protein
MSDLRRLLVQKNESEKNKTWCCRMMIMEQSSKREHANLPQLELCLKAAAACGKFIDFDEMQFRIFISEIFTQPEGELIHANFEYFWNMCDEYSKAPARQALNSLYNGNKFYSWVPHGIYQVVIGYCASELSGVEGKTVRRRSNSFSTRRKSVTHHQRKGSLSGIADLPGSKPIELALTLEAPSNPPSLESSDGKSSDSDSIGFTKPLVVPAEPVVGFIDESPALDKSHSGADTPRVRCRKKKTRPAITPETFEPL